MNTPFTELTDAQKAELRAGLHPYMQASLLHQLDPVVGTFKFRIGEEVKHLETGGIYLITGLPNENVMKEGSRWVSAYAYLMYDGRSATRSRKQMEDGRFVSVPEGSAAKYAELKAREGIDFDEFIKYGETVAEALIDGYPWSFAYKGHPVTHEAWDRYLISEANGRVLTFRRGDRLVDRDGVLEVVRPAA